MIAGIIGVALSKLVINQARFVATQDGMRGARSGARSAMNLLTFELRQVSWGGVVAATGDSIDVRVPYAFGMVCGYTAGQTILTLIPPDSTSYVGSGPTTSGYAWQNASGSWIFVEPATRSGGSTASCYTATPTVTVLYSPGGLAWGVQVTGTAAPVGSLVYLYQKVRYAFAPSAAMAGRTALWRTTLANNTREELVAPFDSTSKFYFLTGSMLTPTSTVPAVLDSIRGLRLKLNAQSENAPQGRTAPLLFRVTADLVFRNHES